VCDIIIIDVEILCDIIVNYLLLLLLCNILLCIIFYCVLLLCVYYYYLIILMSMANVLWDFILYLFIIVYCVCVIDIWPMTNSIPNYCVNCQYSYYYYYCIVLLLFVLLLCVSYLLTQCHHCQPSQCVCVCVSSILCVTNQWLFNDYSMSKYSSNDQAIIISQCVCIYNY